VLGVTSDYVWIEVEARLLTTTHFNPLNIEFDTSARLSTGLDD